MKKVFLALLSVLALGVLAACGTNVESIELDESSVELEVGETVTVTATVEPEDAETGVEWSSDDESVATVDDGEITAESGGTATITATSIDDEEITADVDVTVIPDPDSISLSPDTLELEEGESDTIEASISPSDAIQDVTWESDDESIATVEDGEVTAVAPGETTITVTAERDDDVTESATITVIIASETVEDVMSADIDDEVHTTGVVTGFAYNGYFIEDDTDAIFIYDEEEYYEDVEVGDRVQLMGTRGEYNGLEQIADVTSLEVLESDVDLPDVVDLSDVDLDDDDALDEYQSHRVALSEGYLVETLDSDDYGNLSGDLYSPFDDNSIAWRYDSRLELPDDDMVFELEENDLLDVDGMHLGWYNGPQLTYNGDHAISESDRSLDMAIELEDVEDDELDLSVSEEFELEWTVQPQSYVDNQDLDFESSDDSVVSVDTDGVLTAESAGTATITLTSQEDSDVSLDIEVTVENLEVALNDELNDDDQLRLRTTEEFELDYTVSPDFASQDVTVTSDDDAIVDVTEDGELEAVAEGTAEITITSDADPEASMTVEVLVEDSEPVLDYFEEYDIYEGDSFDPLEDVTASDYIDGDLTDDVEVTDDGGYDVDTKGEYTITIAVTNSFGNTTEGEITLNVLEEGEVIAPTGEYNFLHVDSNTRRTLFAAAERYLLETGYGGVPSTVNAGYVLYSSRMQLPVEDPVPVMDYGTLYGSMATDDSAVLMDDGDYGEEGEYTYRTAETSDPGQFNQWAYEDAISSDMITLFMDSLYYFDFNDDKSSYEVYPSMATGMPTPSDDTENEFGVVVDDEWKVDIRDDLEWYFHEDIDADDYDKTIDAHDFIETYKLALKENWTRAISGGGDFTTDPQTIVNAQEYADGEVDWDDVGLKAEDDHTLVFEFKGDMSEWTTIYWLSSFVTTPIHMGLYDDVGDSYGTSEDTIAAHGPFYLDYYEPDKMLRFEENPNFHDPDRISFTGYDVQIIPDDESRFQEFSAGKLDTVGVPPGQYEAYQNDPRIKYVPGATTFRASINSLGTVENQQEEFPGSDFEPEPLLAWESEDGDTNFRNALYHAWDREKIAEEVQVTSEPMMFYFSEAYLVAPQDEEDITFREWDIREGNKLVAEKEFDDEDIDSEYNPDDYDNFDDWADAEFTNWYEDNRDPNESIVGEGFGVDTYGYNPDLSTRIFEDAMDDLVDDGVYELGTDDDPLVIELQFTIQAGSSAQTNYADFMKDELEDILKYEDDNGDVLAYVTLDIDPVEFPENYTSRLQVGATDIGMGGIAGSTLNAASFLDVFCDDNRGYFTLDWGIDTSTANIEVTYEKEDGQEVTELWSFNALVAALSGDTEVDNGEEVD